MALRLFGGRRRWGTSPRPAWWRCPILLILAAAVPLAGIAPAGVATAAPPAGLSDALVASIGEPLTALAFAGNDLLVATKSGKLHRLTDGAGAATPILDLSDVTCVESERGLLGIAVDPTATGNVYLFYTLRKGGNTCVNRVSRFTLGATPAATRATEEPILDNVAASGPNHNAGDLEFGPDGFLFVSTGDATRGANAQTLGNLNGKILRVERDGDAAPGNPFAGDGSASCALTGSAPAGRRCAEIFALGLRNPFRFAFDPNAAGPRFFINDVGAATWEEIDEARAGANYGWPRREGPCKRGKPDDKKGRPEKKRKDRCRPVAGFEQPVYAYRHRRGCRSITGGAFVPNAAAGPWDQFEGDYLFADYTCGTIFRLETSQGSFGRTTFSGNAGPVIDLRFAPDNDALYYVRLDGQVRRIAPS